MQQCQGVRIIHHRDIAVEDGRRLVRRDASETVLAAKPFFETSGVQTTTAPMVMVKRALTS
jgi:hypothetical protein